MPVELIAAWLVMQAYKLIVVPVASGVRQQFVNELSEKIAAPVSDKLFGDHASGPNDGAPSGTDADAGFTADTDFVETIEKAPEARAVLGGEMERILGVKLGAAGVQGGVDGVKWGSDGWYVSAYAAILWRIAMLAVWEERPIAIQGALQGREWVTVCVPRVRKVIAPSTMWRQLDSRTLRRVYNNQGPADFFVRQIKDETVRGDEVAERNEQFMIQPNAAFKPIAAESVADGWHRIDGVNRKWVLLKPDAEAEQAIKGPPVILLGEPFGERNLETNPPEFYEYPDEWQPLLRIGSEKDGIAALSAGADEFARASEASAAAVQAALDDQGPLL
jgi:hypothetical protein